MGTLSDALVELIENLILWANEMAQEGKKKKPLSHRPDNLSLIPERWKERLTPRRCFLNPMCVSSHIIYTKDSNKLKILIKKITKHLILDG